jgi:hypothetical protein
MKISIVQCVILSAIFCVSAQASESSWSAKSTDSQQGNILSSSTKSTLAENSNLSVGIPLGAKTTPQTQVAKPVVMRTAAKNINQDYWVYDAYVTLYTDSDYDGYYHHFSVDFDVDSIYAHSDVYARLYLGVNEEFREYHTTSNFNIARDITADQLTVETELLSGFYPNDYEVLIEIYDGYTNELVAVYDGYNDADLYLLSIESQDNELIYDDPGVLVISASGGSASGYILLLLPILLVRLTMPKR